VIGKYAYIGQEKSERRTFSAQRSTPKLDIQRSIGPI
jgi:hypothetical protein